jgi:hypothetical protein
MLMKKTILERITNLRIVLAHHSYIYYTLGTSVIPDGTWDQWARELVVLQAIHGEEHHPEYDKWFKDWDGTTGFLLCDIPGLAFQVRRTNPELFKKEK